MRNEQIPLILSLNNFCVFDFGSFIYYLLYLSIEYIKQKIFLKKYLFGFLKINQTHQDPSYTIIDEKRIKNVYGFSVILLFAGPFQRLRGLNFSLQQRKCFTIVGALSGLIDDYFDKFKLHPDQIIRIADHNSNYQVENEHQKVSRLLLHELEKVSDLNHDYSLALTRLMNSQKESLKQFDKNISKSDIEQITIQKAGNSALLYSKLLVPLPNQDEVEMLYHLSVLVQMANDVFDIYKDKQDGIFTLANTSSSVGEISKNLEKYISIWKNALEELPFSRRSKLKFYRQIDLLVISRTQVCLFQLNNLETKYRHFDIRLFSRQQLVCDMEKPKNILLWFKFFIAESKRINEN